MQSLWKNPLQQHQLLAGLSVGVAGSMLITQRCLISSLLYGILIFFPSLPSPSSKTQCAEPVGSGRWRAQSCNSHHGECAEKCGQNASLGFTQREVNTGLISTELQLQAGRRAKLEMTCCWLHTCEKEISSTSNENVCWWSSVGTWFRGGKTFFGAFNASDPRIEFPLSTLHNVLLELNAYCPLFRLAALADQPSVLLHSFRQPGSTKTRCSFSLKWRRVSARGARDTERHTVRRCVQVLSERGVCTEQVEAESSQKHRTH